MPAWGASDLLILPHPSPPQPAHPTRPASRLLPHKLEQMKLQRQHHCHPQPDLVFFSPLLLSTGNWTPTSCCLTGLYQLGPDEPKKGSLFLMHPWWSETKTQTSGCGNYYDRISETPAISSSHPDQQLWKERMAREGRRLRVKGKVKSRDGNFPGGPVVKILPANAPSLVWEDPTCWRATKPVSHDYWRLHT